MTEARPNVARTGAADVEVCRGWAHEVALRIGPEIAGLSSYLNSNLVAAWRPTASKEKP
jgi:hypothetical protein